MALGSSWGTREEMLHPRDRHGRFRKKWKMPEGVINKLQAFLERFNPRTFQSDQQASQFVFNKAKPDRFPGENQKRLHFDWDEANDHIRAGDIDPSTQRFIDTMERASVPMPEQMILHRTVGAEAFGLTPDQLGLEDGGLEDFTGRLIADRAYSATNIGSPMGTGPGRIHMTIATPSGQQVIIPASSPNDRRVFLPRDQGYRITKVEPDGTGGWHVMAIAEPPGVARKTPEPVMPGRRGAGLSEAQREERITPAMTPQARQAAAQEGVQTAQIEGTPNPTPGQPAPTPAAPAPVSAPAPANPPAVQGPTSPATGVPERQEPVLNPSVGPSSTSGTSPAEVAQEGQDAARQAEEVAATPAPATPASFQQAVRDADLKAPSRGKRRAEWNSAYEGVRTGKREPADVLRELDTDIEVNKQRLARAEGETGGADPELAQDIKDQEALADLISTHHGVPRRGQGEQAAEAPTPAPAAPAKRATKTAKAAPATKAAPAKKAGPTATPGAPSTTKEATPAPAPAKAVKRTPQDIAAQFKTVKDRGEGDALLEGLTGPELHAVAEAAEITVPKRATKDKLKQTIGQHGYGRRLDSDAISGNGRRMRGDDTSDTDRRLIEAAKKYRGKERNSEEERIVAQADRILGESGQAPPAKKVAKKAAPNPNLSSLSDDELRKIQDSDQFPQRQKDLMQQELDARSAKKAPPAKAVAKKVAPAKTAPSPVDEAEEAFKARVTEAGLPDKVADLRAQAREQKIRGFSTMNKRQLQSALLGDEVPRAGKIAPVTPEKLVPHIQAAESDQAARALLENHTLVDLKALAKSRELEIPKRGVTKDKLKDLILTDVRGEQEGIGGRTPDTSLEDDLGQLGYITLPGERGSQISQEINQAQPDDPEALRRHRDNLESMSKQFRGEGDRNAANMAQAAADAMGMRAQTISGVEEGPARTPVKRAAKAAVPEAGAPEVEAPPKTLDKMLRTELAQVALDEGVDVKKSATKAQFRDAIERHRRLGGRPESTEDQMRRELGAVPVPAQAPAKKAAPALAVPDRAPTPEEISRDNPETPAPAPAKKVTKKAAKKAVADVDRAAESVSGQLKGTFGDQLRATDPEEMRQAARTAGVDVGDGDTAEEIFDNTIKKMLESRMRELGMLPDDPAKPTRATKRVPKGSVAGPRADTPIDNPTRQANFREAWDAQGFQAEGAAGRSLAEVRDDIETGKITPEEGVRRIESDISFNKEEIADIDSQLRGTDLSRDEKTALRGVRGELLDSIRTQGNASRFLRGHAKEEAPITRPELEVQLDGDGRAALDRVDVDGLKKAARDEGLGDIQGDDKDTVVQNIARAVAGRELANRENERVAQEQMAEKAEKLRHAEAIAGIESVMTGTDRAVTARIKSQSKVSRLSPELQQEMLDNAGDRAGLQRILDRVAAENGLTRIATRGENSHFDPESHDQPPGANLKKGDPITVLESGFRSDVRGEDMRVKRAKVTEGHSPVVESLAPAPAPAKAAKFLPPLASGQQRKSATNVEVGDVVQRAGAWNAPPARVTKVERGPSGIDITLEDGREYNNNPNTAYWMGRDTSGTSAAPPKAAVPAKATPPPVVDLDQPTRHNADVIATGLDIDRKGDDRDWMDVVQRSLDRGEDGRQIADGLRREADSQRTVHNIQEAIGAEAAGPAARIDRMERMADRLEGVRAIAKPVNQPTKLEGRKEMGTMSAATAQSRAFSDLKAGKSHADVATALRQAATSVGSRDHDVQTVRPVEISASERSALKRGDAKRLRELAAEIQAQGVAQRAAAKAAKKAAPEKARPSVADDAVATLLMDRIQERNPAVAKAVLAEISPEDRAELDAARERDTARKAAAPKKRTAAEMRRAQTAADMNGISVQEQLERFDQQKEDRKNLSGPIGEMISAQLDDAMRRLQAADNPRLEEDALAGLLAPELKQLASRLGLSTAGSKSTLLQRIVDRVKGREAPGASAERAVPKAPGGRTTQPPKPHSWGTGGQRGDQHYYHPDGTIPRTMDRLGDEGQLDVGGGQSLHNAMGDIATDMVMGRITPDAGLSQLRDVARRLPETSSARGTVEALVRDLHVPMVAMPELPTDTPPQLRQLLDQIRTGFPIARATGRFGSSTYQKSLVDKVADFIREKASGNSSLVGIGQDLATLIHNHTHESQEGSMGLGALSRPLNNNSSEISQALLAWAKEIRARRSS